MFKSDFHELACNCAELTDISDIFIGKNPRNSPFSVVELYEGQFMEIRDFRDF